MKEIWKDIKDYEGLYQVSNWGRVRSLDRLGTDRRKLKGKILSPRERSGYWCVSLRKDGNNIDISVHRLVAVAFIPNPNNFPQVGHKDEKNLKTSIYITDSKGTESVSYICYNPESYHDTVYTTVQTGETVEVQLDKEQYDVIHYMEEACTDIIKPVKDANGN